MADKKVILAVVLIVVIIIILALVLPSLLDSGDDTNNGNGKKQYTATFEHWQSGTEVKTYVLQEDQTQNVLEDTGGNAYAGTFTLTWEDDSAVSPDEFTLTITPLSGSVSSFDPANTVTSQSGTIQIKVYITEPPPETYTFQANSSADAENIVHNTYDIPDMSFSIDIVCNGDTSPLDNGNEVTFNNFYNGFTLDSVE